MTSSQKYALEMTKDIVVAKLSSSSPDPSNEDAGMCIGAMYEAIYNKIYDLCSRGSEDESK